MALCIFDNGVNQGGTGDNAYEDDTNWFDGAKPGNGDYISIEANCTCSTDESTNVLSGGVSHITNGNTLTITTGGKIYQGGAVEFHSDTGATFAFDGGLFRNGSSTNLCTYGAVTCTTNGGTIEIADGKTWILNVGTVITGNPAARLLVKAISGTAYILSATTGATHKHVELEGVQLQPNTELPVSFEDFDVHDTAQGMCPKDNVVVFIRNSWFHGCTDGMYFESGSGSFVFTNVVFGKDATGNADANTTDLRTYKGTPGKITCNNCAFASTTNINADQYGGEIIANAYNQDPDNWRHYQGYQGHSAQPEFGDGAQGASGTAVKCISSAGCADTEIHRFRRLVATIPINTASKTEIDATLYIKGENTKTTVIRIDPDEIFGTEQHYDETADGNWHQRTIPTYTVSGSIGKVCVPIYIDITGASETWYYDTLEYILS